MVKRYNWGRDHMDLHDNGEFVLLADYEALELELAAEQEASKWQAIAASYQSEHLALKARVEALERELAAESATLQEEFRENHRRADKIVALRARVEALEPSAQTKAECDCPSLHGGRCMYPDCSQAASTGAEHANP